MINENIAAGNWKELKGRIRSAWGKLTDDELETTKGDITAIAGMVQKKYGSGQEDVRKKLNDWMSGKNTDSDSIEDRRNLSTKPAIYKTYCVTSRNWATRPKL